MIRKLSFMAVAGLATLMFSRMAFCVPALSTIQQMDQPDGRTFNARLWGDERSHGWETFDGYTIIKDPQTRYWHYAQKQAGTGKMLAGGIVGVNKVTTGTSRHLRPTATASTSSQGSLSRGAAMAAPRSVSRATVTGTRPIPVLMVNFTDTAPTFDSTDFSGVLFGSGTNSMKDYYEEVSYGDFSVSAGTAGVTGWYTASKNHDYYGENDVDGYDKHPAELVYETVAAADAAIDFSEYDTDGNCYVDAVVIIHQGSGEEAYGLNADIWSHQWDLFSAYFNGDGPGVYTTDDVAACGQIKIKDYVIQPETLKGDIQTVGVFAHEYGHVLGLPDLYDIDYTSNGIGNWGLMGAGGWGSVSRPGDSPVHMSAWSKYMLGWVDPVQVDTRLTDELINPASTAGDVYRIFPDNQTGSKEYYLIENRQYIGFDAGLPGTGLAIWHIDDDMAGYSNEDNMWECITDLQCADHHYRVALVQADGLRELERGYDRGDAGDLYPGSSSNTAFSSASSPDSYLYSGSKSHAAVTDISEIGTTVRATLSLTYDITPSVTGGGTISPGVKTTLDRGEDLTFAIAANDGYRISQVYIDGTAVGAIAEYTFTDTQIDHEISAIFASTASSDSGISTVGSGGGSGGGGCFIGSLF